jgi:hypothetical protein
MGTFLECHYGESHKLVAWIFIVLGLAGVVYLVHDATKITYDYIPVPLIGSVKFPESLPVGAYPLAPTVSIDQYFGTYIGTSYPGAGYSGI